MLRKELGNFASPPLPFLPIPYRPVPLELHNTTKTPARETASNLALWHCGVFYSYLEKGGREFARVNKAGRGAGGLAPKHHNATKLGNKRACGWFRTPCRPVVPYASFSDVASPRPSPGTYSKVTRANFRAYYLHG